MDGQTHREEEREREEGREIEGGREWKAERGSLEQCVWGKNK